MTYIFSSLYQEYSKTFKNIQEMSMAGVGGGSSLNLSFS